MRRSRGLGVDDVLIPVVAECDPCDYCDVRGGARPDVGLVGAALAGAAGGSVAEGQVGAGVGMSCFDMAGGVGSASRVAGGFVVGVLVLTNFGTDGRRLVVAGQGVADLLPVPDATGSEGSCVCVVATDAPLSVVAARAVGAEGVPRACAGRELRVERVRGGCDRVLDGEPGGVRARSGGGRSAGRDAGERRAESTVRRCRRGDRGGCPELVVCREGAPRGDGPDGCRHFPSRRSRLVCADGPPHLRRRCGGRVLYSPTSSKTSTARAALAVGQERETVGEGHGRREILGLDDAVADQVAAPCPSAVIPNGRAQPERAAGIDQRRPQPCPSRRQRRTSAQRPAPG